MRGRDAPAGVVEWVRGLTDGLRSYEDLQRPTLVEVEDFSSGFLLHFTTGPYARHLPAGRHVGISRPDPRMGTGRG